MKSGNVPESTVAAGRPRSIGVAAVNTSRSVRRGILCMLLGVFCFAAMDGLVKWLAPRFPVMQIVFCRSP